MAEGAQRHHFISQCYLRGFTAEPASPRLYAVDFRARKTFWPSPVDVALEKRFHTIDVPGEPPNLIEDMISKFESDLCPHFAASPKRVRLPTTETGVCCFISWRC